MVYRKNRLAEDYVAWVYTKNSDSVIPYRYFAVADYFFGFILGCITFGCLIIYQTIRRAWNKPLIFRHGFALLSWFQLSRKKAHPS